MKRGIRCVYKEWEMDYDEENKHERKERRESKDREN